MSAKIDPFVEAPVDRPRISSSAGIDTADIDGLRQGVSMRNDKHRFRGTQPKIWAGTVDHQPPVITFGIPGLFSDCLPFDDTKFDLHISGILDHFLVAATSVTEAFFKAGDDDGDIESFDGAIEPLDIRGTFFAPKYRNDTIAQGPPGTPTNFVPGNIFKPVHVIKSELAEGRRGEPVLQEVSLDDPGIAATFVESGSATLLSTDSYIAEGGMKSGSVVFRAELLKEQPQAVRTLPSFDDTVIVTPSLPKSFLTPERVNFHETMKLMSASTDVESFRRRRSAGAGFTFHSSPFGTDSIAFGGLERYKVPA